MDNMSSILERILHNKCDFCCLCFKAINEDQVNFEDEVIIFRETIRVADVLSRVLGNDIGDTLLSAFEVICINCVSVAATSYGFINTTKSNTECLLNIIEQLGDRFGETLNVLDNFNTLFVSVGRDISTNIYYNNEKLKSKTEAFVKFQNLTNPQKHKESKKSNLVIIPIKAEKKLIPDIKKEKCVIKQEKQTFKPPRPRKSTSTLPTIDMLYDRNDPSNIKCKECFKIFPSTSNLRNHFIRVHAPKVYKCTECPRAFGSVSFLEFHRDESHVSLICIECGKKFNNRHTLRMHERSHFMRFICPDCGRVYKNQNTFKQHITNDICQSESRKSQADAKFTCDYCHKRYSQKITLRVHIQYEHLNYRSHECEWCKKKFSCQSRLKAHAVKHTRERNFHCSICNGKFVTKESLLYHTRTHTGERPYKCPHCDIRFLSTSRRAAHVRSQHTAATEECDVCHTKFRSHQYLQKHKKLHTENKLVRDQTRNKLQVLSNNAHRKSHTIANNFVLMPLNGKAQLVIKNEFNPVKVEDPPAVEEHSVPFEYELSGAEGDSNSQAAKDTVYLEVLDSQDYVFKVSQNVEV